MTAPMRENTPEARLLALHARIGEAPDAVPRLRRFILDLAVRGKVVAQDAGDEPASELLKRIAAEKARLVKAGEIKRPKPVDPVTAAERAFSPPHGWTWTRLADIAVCLDYMRKPINGTERDRRIDGKAEDELFPYYGATQQQGWIDDYIFNEELVLLGEDGVPFFDPYRSKAYIIRGKTWVNNHAHVFKGILISHPFLAHYLNAFDYTGRVVGATRSKLNQARAIDIPVPLPPLAEQRRIVAKVEELMGLLDRLEAARTAAEATRDRLTAASLARLTAPDADPADFPANARFALATLPALTTRPDQIKPLRQTILNLAVRGKLVAQDPSDEPALDYLLGLDEVPSKTRKLLKPLDPSVCGGELPAAWAWLPLGVIIRAMDAGWSPQCENHPRSSADEWGVLKTTAVQALAFDPMQHKLLPAKLKPRPEFEAEVGDILVTRAGPKNRVGVSCVVDVPCPRLMISDKLIRFHAVGDLSARYIALTLNAGYTFDQIEAAKSGMAVMQMNISQGKLRAIPIPLPPLAEQHRIVAKVDALMALCDRLEAALTTTDTTRARLLDALLHEALTPTATRATEAAE